MLRVYYLKLSDYSAIPEQMLWSKISEEAKREIEYIKSESVRRLKCFGKIMTKALIESLWQIHAKDYDCVTAENGKPYIQAAVPIFYNLSHSGDYVVCALSDREVGIDVQKIGVDKFQLAQRFFHPNEIKNLAHCKPADRIDLFYSYWTAKESFLKYTGTGLSGYISNCEIFFKKDSIDVMLHDVLQPVYLRACLIDVDYKCMVCSEYQEKPEVKPFILNNF